MGPLGPSMQPTASPALVVPFMPSLCPINHPPYFLRFDSLDQTVEVIAEVRRDFLAAVAIVDTEEGDLAREV